MKEHKAPFYNPLLSYEDNYRYGPFGDFAHHSENMPVVRTFSFLGHSVDIPFGIASGPLLNSRYIQAAWEHGFSLATYKTVRTRETPAHSYPNIIRIDASEDYRVTPNEIVYGSLDLTTLDVSRDGITNSFGVPSKDVPVWQEDVRRCIGAMKKGSLLMVSFMGTKKDDTTRDEIISDYVRACHMVRVTTAPILEVNVSCPNIGKAGMICHDTQLMKQLLEALHSQKGNNPLLVKLGYFTRDQQQTFEEILDIVKHFANGVVAINTIQAQVIDFQGKQSLPGDTSRIVSGVCGAPIRWAGLEMAERIVAYKKKKGWKDFVVVGVGGVVSPDDYFEYMKRGVDAVQSATGAMWRPNLALEIRNRLAKQV